MIDELYRLVELHERGHISPAEYEETKRQLLNASPQGMGVSRRNASAPDGTFLLYGLISSWLKRTAAAMAVIALLFGLVSGWSGLHYVDMNAQMDAIKDAPIVQGFGVRIPDPRPTIERAVLEAKATAYGGLAAVTGVIALGTLVGALLVRPPSSPTEAEHSDQPQLAAARAARG